MTTTIVLIIIGAAVLAYGLWRFLVRRRRIREEQQWQARIDAIPDPTMLRLVELKLVANVIAALPAPYRTQVHKRFEKALCDAHPWFKPEDFCLACNVEWPED